MIQYYPHLLVVHWLPCLWYCNQLLLVRHCYIFPFLSFVSPTLPPSPSLYVGLLLFITYSWTDSKGSGDFAVTGPDTGEES